MATFTSPCNAAALAKKDAASMPELTVGIYLTDYISPALRHSQAMHKLTMDTRPKDFMPEASAMRILPSSFDDFYLNSVSVSIGDKLELEMQDDTPAWKRKMRAEAAVSWKRPLAERRDFIRYQEWNMRGKK